MPRGPCRPGPPRFCKRAWARMTVRPRGGRPRGCSLRGRTAYLPARLSARRRKATISGLLGVGDPGFGKNQADNSRFSSSVGNLTVSTCGCDCVRCLLVLTE